MKSASKFDKRTFSSICIMQSPGADWWRDTHWATLPSQLTRPRPIRGRARGCGDQWEAEDGPSLPSRLLLVKLSFLKHRHTPRRDKIKQKNKTYSRCKNNRLMERNYATCICKFGLSLTHFLRRVHFAFRFDEHVKQIWSFVVFTRALCANGKLFPWRRCPSAMMVRQQPQTKL